MRVWRRDIRLLTMLVDLLAIIAAFQGTLALRVSQSDSAKLSVGMVLYLQRLLKRDLRKAKAKKEGRGWIYSADPRAFPL